MILSRVLSKHRIASGVRPNWAAAWGPVAFDAACLVFAFMLLYRPFQTLAETNDWSVGAISLALLVVGFIPVQVVLILSSLWAAKSRFKDDETP